MQVPSCCHCSCFKTPCCCYTGHSRQKFIIAIIPDTFKGNKEAQNSTHQLREAPVTTFTSPTAEPCLTPLRCLEKPSLEHKRTSRAGTSLVSRVCAVDEALILSNEQVGCCRGIRLVCDSFSLSVLRVSVSSAADVGTLSVRASDKASASMLGRQSS